MTVLFIVSSLGDTNLAMATARFMEDRPYILPLTQTATDKVRTEHIARRVALPSVTGSHVAMTETLSPEQITAMNTWIAEKGITTAYIGVPSPLHERLPLEIAKHLSVPVVIAYEYLFRPEGHVFHDYVAELAHKPHSRFAVPTARAAADILGSAPEAQTVVTGHLAIDSALKQAPPSPENVAFIRDTLGIQPDQFFAFVSGTTQPTAVDASFVQALLQTLATGEHPDMQVRFGIHPGIHDLQAYLTAMLAVCAEYPSQASQFRFILSPVILGKLSDPAPFVTSPFFMEADINGPMAASAADRVAQAVPGALLNEAGLRGKPVMVHQQTTSYLPSGYFDTSVDTFFRGHPRLPATREDLDLKDVTAPEAMAAILLS